MDRLLSIADGAKVVSVSRATLYREHKAGRIRFVKVRNATRVAESELDRYVKQRLKAAA